MKSLVWYHISINESTTTISLTKSKRCILPTNYRYKISKLLLNSIYGKSILKPMMDEINVINQNKLIPYIYLNYNLIKEISFSSTKALIKKINPINNHFNLSQFGASVLSWSKHIIILMLYIIYKIPYIISLYDKRSYSTFNDVVKKIVPYR